MQKTLKMNEGGRTKSTAKTALFLGIVLAGLIVLIVYQLKGKTPTKKPETRTYAGVIDRINADVAALKRKMAGKEPLDVEKTLAERPAPPPKVETASEAAVVPDISTPAAEAPAPPLPRESAIQKILPKNLIGKSVDTPAPPPPPLVLKGIIWTEKAPLAIVNGNLVKINDAVAPYKVIAIEKDRVLFEDAKGERRVVMLHEDRAAEKQATP